MYTNAYSSSSHNCPNQKQLKCSSKGEWINKLLIYPYNETLLSNKRNEQRRHTATWTDFKGIIQVKKVSARGYYTLYGSIYMTFLKR